MLSIFKLPVKGKSRGVMLDEFLNAHDMIILAAPHGLDCISKFCSLRTLEQLMEGLDDLICSRMSKS